MGKYVWPCPSYSRISSGYGNRTCPFHGKEFHDGVDLAAASGAPILAFGPGTVTKSGWYGGYGNYISIDHGGGLMSFYGHASTSSRARKSPPVRRSPPLARPAVRPAATCTSVCIRTAVASIR